MKEYPPFYETLEKHFKFGPQTIFTYGDVIFNPSGCEITRELEIHEGTHMIQQGATPEVWWDRYITDPEFRLEQELAAYRNQYQAYCESDSSREGRAKYAMKLAWDLSGPGYGRIIQYAEAAKLIRAT